MKIYHCKQGEQAELRDVPNELDALQEAVGGYIQAVSISSTQSTGNDLVMVCNEEGKIKKMLPNRWVKGDVICGDFFFCGTDGEDFCDVPERDIPMLKAFYGDPQFDKKGERIWCQPKKKKS